MNKITIESVERKIGEKTFTYYRASGDIAITEANMRLIREIKKTGNYVDDHNHRDDAGIRKLTHLVVVSKIDEKAAVVNEQVVCLAHPQEKYYCTNPVEIGRDGVPHLRTNSYGPTVDVRRFGGHDAAIQHLNETYWMFTPFHLEVVELASFE